MKGRKFLWGALACVIVSASAAMAQSTAGTATPMTVGNAGLAATQPAMRPLKLSRIMIKMRRGETMGRSKIGPLCLFPREIYWTQGSLWDFTTDEMDEVFREEMGLAGYRIAGNPSNLFEDPNDGRAEYLIGGIINQVQIEVCYPMGGFDNFSSAKGSATVEVEWQVYSELERKVVGTIKTSGAAKSSDAGRRGNIGLLLDAFGDATRKLADNQRLRAALSGPQAVSTSVGGPAERLAPLPVKAPATAPASAGEAVGSTVLVLAGGHGSGFLISPDGYVLTNRHVVGDAQYVKIRWPDGVETLGEVLRSNKPRDVALIKTDAKGRKALRLRSQPVTVGEDIYAIGAPQERTLQNTLTKGIVSATRVMDGLSYIQGDVGVTHGNSGGPIVDGKGQVVGLTVSGRVDAAMVNFFIPIQDGLTFLGLQMVPAK